MTLADIYMTVVVDVRLYFIRMFEKELKMNRLEEKGFCQICS